jgi:hypothetical protein
MAKQPGGVRTHEGMGGPVVTHQDVLTVLREVRAVSPVAVANTLAAILQPLIDSRDRETDP